jgi:hypothetical protein
VSTVSDFVALVTAHGSDVRYRRVDSTTPCPCRTPEGFRDPEWHEANPLAPVCDENGMLPGVGEAVDISVKAFVQPIQSTRATRLSAEYIAQLFGEVEADDHLGIFPITWGGTELNFYNWSQTGQDFIEYDDRRFICVNANRIPDPSDGNPKHHWELGLRLIGTREEEGL